MDPGEAVPAMGAGGGVFFLATQTVKRGLVFFDHVSDRFEVVSDPVDVGGGKYLATVRQLTGTNADLERTVQLNVGRQVEP
jgi:hypothetical protein